MKKNLLAAAAVAVLFASSALAADAPKAPPMTTPPGAMEKAANPEEEAMRFKHRKEEKLLMLGNRITEMQKQKDCIQASTDMDSFRKCGGDRGDRMRMMMDHKRGGMDKMDKMPHQPPEED